MKKVSFVSFHIPLFIPELGNVGESLPSAKKTLPDLLLWKEDGENGVYFSTGKKSGFIPDAVCKVYTFVPEPPKAVKK